MATADREAPASHGRRISLDSSSAVPVPVQSVFRLPQGLAGPTARHTQCHTDGAHPAHRFVFITQTRLHLIGWLFNRKWRWAECMDSTAYAPSMYPLSACLILDQPHKQWYATTLNTVCRQTDSFRLKCQILGMKPLWGLRWAWLTVLPPQCHVFLGTYWRPIPYM